MCLFACWLVLGFISTYVLSFSFGIVCIWLRNTNGTCRNSAPLRSPLECDTLGRNTSNHIHRRQSMCHYIDGRSFLECPIVDFSYKIQAMVPNTLGLCRQALCGRDCMVSIGNDIWWKREEKWWIWKISGILRNWELCKNIRLGLQSIQPIK